MRQFASTLWMVVVLQGMSAIVQAQAQPALQPPSDPIEQVLAAGWMDKYPYGQFHPELLISRAELASILVKAFGLDKRAAANQENLIEVQDVPASHWAYKDIQTVIKTGIMKGYRVNIFFPNQKVPRAAADLCPSLWCVSVSR